MKSDVRVAWLITFAIGGWLIYLLAPVLTPFIAAALLAYIGDPLADRLQKLKLPRTLAVVCVFLLTFVLIGVLVLLVGPLVRQQVGALFSALPSIASQVEQVWLPNAAEFLGVEPGEDFGLSAFLIGNQYRQHACRRGHEPVSDSYPDVLPAARLGQNYPSRGGAGTGQQQDHGLFAGPRDR
mgnify:CR=1 FL=1